MRPTKGYRRVRFSLPAQRGKEIFLAGTFNNWDAKATRLKWNPKTSAYEALLTMPAGRYEYKFVIDGYWCIDPNCAEWVPNRMGTLNSVRRVEPTADRARTSRSR